MPNKPPAMWSEEEVVLEETSLEDVSIAEVDGVPKGVVI